MIIPARNRREFIPMCIVSVLSQRRTPDRVVLVDDGSDPPLKDIADEYGIEYVRCQVGDGSSGAKARNVGLRHLHDCDYILPIDSDDFIEPDYIAKCLRALAKHERIGIAYPEVQSFGALSGSRTGTVSVGGMVRADVLRQIGGFPETVGWDEQALSQVIDSIGFGGVHCDAQYYYRRHQNAISGDYWNIRRPYVDTVDHRSDFLGVACLGGPDDPLELDERVSSVWTFYPRDVPDNVTLHVERTLPSQGRICQLNRLFTVATPDYLLLTTGTLRRCDIARLLDMLQPEDDAVCLGEDGAYLIDGDEIHPAPWSMDDVHGFPIRTCLISKDVYKRYRFRDCDEWQREFFSRLRRDGRTIKARWLPCRDDNESEIPDGYITQTIRPTSWTVVRALTPTG